jgi:hypothetical protein
MEDVNMLSLCIRRAVAFAAAAVLLDQGWAAAQSTATVYAVTATNRLLTFSSANPGAPLRTVALSNLASGEVMVGIDVHWRRR